ncbi:MAG: uridine kinase [Flavobacteriales bacterium]|nr:uridine kinase [Flavobacteriales bacterium]
MKILALIGGSGSGKSTVLDGLRNHFGERAAVLSLDNYYRPKSELPVDENGETNFDMPVVIDDETRVSDIDVLRAGKSIHLSTYTYNRDVMKSETVTIDPAEWLIVEGLFAMAYPAMEERVDLVGYIDASPETRLARRIARDGSERGYTEDEVRYQWKNHVRPADIQFIEPWKTKADVVVDNEKDWKPGLNELIDKMEKA